MSGAELAADVAIVGGGLVGAATAFFLRRRGRSVILIEPRSDSTSRACPCNLASRS